MQLSDLAPELLSSIIDELSLNDLVCFSQNCHRIYAVAYRKIRYHQEAQAEHSALTLGNEKDEWLGINTISELCCSRWGNLYPRNLTINAAHTYIWPSPAFTTHFLKRIYEKESRPRESLQRVFNTLFPNQLRAEPSILQALAIRVLPNIRVLSYHTIVAFKGLMHVSSLLFPPRPLYLTRLRELVLDLDPLQTWPVYGIIPSIARFLSLPNLKTIQLRGVWLVSPRLDAHIPATSNLESLILRDCEAYWKPLQSLLKPMKNLKHFEYSYICDRFMGSLFYPKDGFHARYVVQLLRRYTRNTLETLVLDCVYRNYPTSIKPLFSRLICSLRDFKTLKSLTLNAELFLCRPTSLLRQWTLLPKTLEELKITRLSKCSKKTIRQLLITLPDLYKLNPEQAVWHVSQTMKIMPKPVPREPLSFQRTDLLESLVPFLMHWPPSILPDELHCKRHAGETLGQGTNKYNLCSRNKLRRWYVRYKYGKPLQTFKATGPRLFNSAPNKSSVLSSRSSGAVRT